jgi:hypothetical protein
MKKLFVLFITFIFLVTGCKKNSQQIHYTILGDYTPYEGFIEKMNGKVEKVVERTYWTVADADTFKRGNPITIKERDSLKIIYDFEANFDSVGDLLSCKYLDENNKIIGNWQFSKENNRLALAQLTWQDTIRQYQKLKCNENGKIIEAKGFRAEVDTLWYSYTENYNETGDTILYLVFNYKGILDMKILNLYNEKGQFVSYETYNKDGAFVASDKVIYNEKGTMSELTFFDKDKKVTETVQRTYLQYDEKGNWLKAIAKDTKGHVVISERTYTYLE